jgi:hypothetical protein
MSIGEAFMASHHLLETARNLGSWSDDDAGRFAWLRDEFARLRQEWGQLDPPAQLRSVGEDVTSRLEAFLPVFKLEERFTGGCC